MTLDFTEAKAEEICDALRHGAMSTHHSRCSIKKTNHCNCHVVKSAKAFSIFTAAISKSKE